MVEVPRAVREAAYVAVGFGVIGFQRAQVRRREVLRVLGRLAGRLPAPARDLLCVVSPRPPARGS